jgi:transcriptional regulator with XRE-family HTH domain
MSCSDRTQSGRECRYRRAMSQELLPPIVGLRPLRIALGKSTREVASESGLSVTTLSRLENGERPSRAVDQAVRRWIDVAGGSSKVVEFAMSLIELRAAGDPVAALSMLDQVLQPLLRRRGELAVRCAASHVASPPGGGRP